MKFRIFFTLLFSASLAAGAVYVYTLLDPRLDIILLKNEEILQLDNKIAELNETNAELNEQVSSIASVVKTNETSSGKINDEYKVCLRVSDRLKKKNRQISAELALLKNKNKILQEYVQVKNDVTSLKEQIASLNNEKQQLTDQLGPAINMNLDVEGGPIEADTSIPAENEINQQ